MSSTEKNLFLNDDISIKQKFRPDFENNLAVDRDFFAINNSFSHFLLSKRVVRKIGWFDERFLGVGQEDGDYLIRMAQGNIKLESFSCRDIINFVAPNNDAGFQNISSITSGKYSSINREFMEKKWFFNHFGDKDFDPSINFIWNNQEYLVKLKNEMETPNFYNHVLLDDDIEFASNSKSFSNKISDYKENIKSFLKKV